MSHLSEPERLATCDGIERTHVYARTVKSIEMSF